MAQTGFTPIQLYRSSTAGATPSASNLVAGELAINTADGKLFYLNNLNVVQLIGSPAGSNTQVQYNNAGAFGANANFTFNGTTVTTANDASISGLTVGKGGGAVATNVALGTGVFGASTTGGNNVAVGQTTLSALTSGSTNIAVGDSTLTQLTTGTYNTAIGHGALFQSGTNSGFNTAVGGLALQSNTGSQNTAVGQTAGQGATGFSTGGANSFFGYNCAQKNTTGSNNSAFGWQSLVNNTTAGNLTAFGTQSLANNTTNVATLGTITGGSGYTDGTYAGVVMTLSSGSTAITYPTATIVVAGGVVTTVTITSAGVGFKDTTTVLTAPAASIGGTGSGFSVPVATLASGVNNTALGFRALFSNTTGSSNTAIGYYSGYGNASANANTTGSNNTYIGYQTVGSANNNTNEMVIGYQAVGLGSNTTTIGNSSTNSTTLYGSVTAGSNSANYATISGGATTKAVQFQTLGSDTNISQVFQSKGTGAIDLAAGSSGVNISNGGTVTAITRVVAGTYTVAPIATISAPTTAGGVTATASVTLQLLATSTIAAAGSGYAIGDTITLVGGTSSVTATLTVATLSGSGVATFTVSNAGIYTVLPTNPISTTSSGSGTGFQLTGSWSLTATLPVTNAGSGYVEQPTVTISGGTGSGGTAYASVGAGSIIRGLGSTSTQCLDFYTPSGINSNIPQFRIRDTTADTYLMISNAAGSTSLTPQGGANSTLFLTSFGTGSVRLGTNSTSTYEQLRVSNTTSAVNYVQVTGAVTGTATIPRATVLSSQGSDTNISLTIFPKGTGIVYTNQNAPVAYDATSTLLIVDILSQIITTTSSTAVSLTLPTGTLTDTGILGGTAAVNTAFEWSIINLGSAVGAITLVAGSNHTIVGSTAIAVGATARFKTRKTATNTFITYRIA